MIATLLGLTLKQQLAKDLLCWAAIAETVSAFYAGVVPRPWWEIIKELTGDVKCANYTDAMFSIDKKCYNKSGKLSDALADLKNRGSLNGEIDCKEALIVDELDAGRPVGIDRGKHSLVIAGYVKLPPVEGALPGERARPKCFVFGNPRDRGTVGLEETIDPLWHCRSTSAAQGEVSRLNRPELKECTREELIVAAGHLGVPVDSFKFQDKLGTQLAEVLMQQEGISENQRRVLAGIVADLNRFIASKEQRDRLKVTVPLPVYWLRWSVPRESDFTSARVADAWRSLVVEEDEVVASVEAHIDGTEVRIFQMEIGSNPRILAEGLEKFLGADPEWFRLRDLRIIENLMLHVDLLVLPRDDNHVRRGVLLMAPTPEMLLSPVIDGGKLMKVIGKAREIQGF